jgi:hypothetical protein
MIGLLVLGGVLLLVAITGGKFKLFGAEVDSAVSSKTVRLLSGVLGTLLIVLSIGKSSQDSGSQVQPASARPNQAPADTTPKPASDSKPGESPVFTAKTAPDPQPPSAESPDGAGSRATGTPVATPSENPGVSGDEYAIVFDPPSNVRVLPSSTGFVLCSVTAKISIRILGTDGNYYKTDICHGQVGYIHRSQVKF